MISKMTRILRTILFLALILNVICSSTHQEKALRHKTYGIHHKARLNPALAPRGGVGGKQVATTTIPFTSRHTHATIIRAGSSKGQNDENSSFFPIKMSELPQFISMSTMMFLFIYVFTTVRDTKDTLVVSNCGAEAIPFLKLYGVMPTALLFIMGYSKLSQVLDKQMLFYVTLVPFFIFYGLFAFVLFPNRDVLHFNVVDETSAAGIGNAAVNLMRYWSYSLYFIVSEIWASASIPLLFWQCANDVTSMSQAKRFYSLFAVVGNLAPIVSGKVMSYIVSIQKTSDDFGFESTLKYLAAIKIAICAGIMYLYNAVYKMANATAIEEQTASRKGKKVPRSNGKGTIKPAKKNISLHESMLELTKSSELRAMATMVICYNICVELTEVLWKGILRKQYPGKAEYMSFMAKFSENVGKVALILQLMASSIITALGWKWSALVTPLTMAILAVPFYVAVALSQNAKMEGTSTLVTLAGALTVGTWQIISSKVTKYSLFDPCKEMAYIPMGPEAKVKGKAAVDVLGARLGRGIGSASQQALVMLVGNGSIINCAPSLGVAYAITIGFWVRAVSILGNLMNKKEEETVDKKRGKDKNE